VPKGENPWAKVIQIRDGNTSEPLHQTVMKRLTNEQIKTKAYGRVVFAVVFFLLVLILAASPLTDPPHFSVRFRDKDYTEEDCSTNVLGCVNGP
jgi:hypothetical protein